MPSEIAVEGGPEDLSGVDLRYCGPRDLNIGRHGILVLGQAVQPYDVHRPVRGQRLDQGMETQVKTAANGSWKFSTYDNHWRYAIRGSATVRHAVATFACWT